MKLVVLAGAKKDAVVPLKKERFVIGRAKECSLRAGSDAISRRHCEILRGAEETTVRDLGSRNGTYVNDQKIEGEVPLHHGDRLRVGPLEFRFESEGQLNNVKHPKVGSVAEAAARVAEKGREEVAAKGFEDHVSDWLLEEPQAGGAAIRETQSFSLDETRALANARLDLGQEDAESDDGDTSAEDATEESSDKKKKKKTPGKLPKDAFAKKQTKDSTEAAAQILRDMARRR